MDNVLPAFFLGLTLGGMSCLAVQGGLLASTIASRTNQKLQDKSKNFFTLWPISSFVLAKLLAYTLLGALLGFFGQKLAVSDQIRIIMQLLVGLYMIAVALYLLNVHPLFRYVVIQPPHALSRLIRKQSKNSDIFAPALLGAMTVFIPCAVTLAAEAMALSSGNAASGAAIMFAYILGTTPLFFSLGFLTTALGESFKNAFVKIAAIVIIFLSLSTINGSLLLMGSPVTLETLYQYSPIEINLDPTTQADPTQATQEDGVQTAQITVLPDGYSPKQLTVKVGVPVRLTLSAGQSLGCTSVFKIPRLDVTKTLTENGTTIVEFTPTQKGTVPWTCSMGMYTGTLNII